MDLRLSIDLLVFSAGFALLGCPSEVVESDASGGEAGIGGHDDSSGGAPPGTGGVENSGAGGVENGGAGGVADGGRGGDADGGTADGGGAGTYDCDCLTGEYCLRGTCVEPIRLLDENNYRTTSRLFIPSVETAPGDIGVDLTYTSADLVCEGINPEDIGGTLAFYRFANLSEEEVSERVSRGFLDPAEIDFYAELGAPSLNLADEYFESDEHTYLFMLRHGTSPPGAAISMSFAKPTATSTNTSVVMPDGCGQHEFVSDFSSVEPVVVPRDAALVVDWSGLTRDGLGNPIVFENIDQLSIFFFRAPLSELNGEIFNRLDYITNDDHYTLDVAGLRSASLVDARAARNVQRDRFPGFERPESGSWILRLMCSTCVHAGAPVIMLIEPE